MSSHATSQDARSAQDAQRRKRKERAAKNQAPEPKDIVSGAGQPLDLSVRRELEEQLGHDFSQVRLHTDRDAGALTDMLGADAVAVGQDIFFREGAYRPGTADGQRLLAHELLHTVQNPHGLGALRAGRDLGAVSLPQQAMEREAESAAQAAVSDAVQGSLEAESAASEVEPGGSTPGWLRYATVDADRHRMELLDPATLVDRLANGILRSLRGDPEDKSKRTRVQLGRLPVELLDDVLERLETRLLGPEYDQVLDLVDQVEHRDDDLEAGRDSEQHSLAAPVVEIDLAAHLRYQRERELESAREERKDRQESRGHQDQDRPTPEEAPANDPGRTGRPEQSTDTPAPDDADRTESSSASGSASEAGQSPSAQDESSSQGTSSSQQSEASSGQTEKGTREEAGSSSGAQESEGGAPQQGAPAPAEQGPATADRAGATVVADRQVKPEDQREQDRRTGSPTTAGGDAQLLSAHSSLEGTRNQDLDALRYEPAPEVDFGSGTLTEVDRGDGEPSAWDIKLQPEDFLPEQDLDVSGVPTAEDMEPGAPAALPSFPAPPETRADKVHALREAEDTEDAAAAQEREKAEKETTGGPSAPGGPSEGAEGGPSEDVRPAEGDLEGPTTEPGAGVASKDPKSGADPKAGPVEAETAMQAAPGKPEAAGQVQEKATKEEQGTPAAGDRAPSGEEDAPQQAAGGQATPQEPEAKKEETGGPPTSEAEAASTGSASASSPQSSRSTGETVTSAPGGGGQEASGTQSEGNTSTPAPEPKDEKSSAPRSRTSSAPARPSAQDTAKPAPAQDAAPAPKPAAESSPEPAAPAPAVGTGAPGGGGGAAGGGAAAAGGRGPAPAKGKKDSAPAPNLSQVPPEAGLATASQLEPHKALQAMGGLSGSVDRNVGEEHQALASSPPSMERPAGAPQTLHGRPRTDAPARYSESAPEKSETPDKEDAEVEGAKKPEGEIAAAEAAEPGGWDTFKMALGFGLGKLANLVGIEVDASELAAKFAGLPTKDEALKQAEVGQAPGVGMKGDAEQKSGEQGEAVDAKGEETATTARDDAGRSMGEDQVYPDAPKEQLTSKVPGQQKGAKGGGPATGAGTGAVPPEAASKVAEHDRGPQLHAAFSDGSRGMSEARKTKNRDTRSSKQRHKQQVDAEIAKNSKSQSGERDKAMSDVTAQRETWRTEQDQELKKLGTKKTERQEKVRKDVKDREEQTDKDVEKEKKDGDDKVEKETVKAERDAEKKRDDSVEESGNWVTKAFDWIKQKVIEIKNAIVRVIKAARDAVVDFIENFKETVEGWIDAARKFVVETIKNLIEDLIEFAKAMVQAIIDLANRIRTFITDLIAAAIALVNKLATMLKKIITDLLNAIGELLSKILSVLKKMLMDVVKAVVDAVKTVMKYASQLLGALGDFMLIAVDFLSDPGGWLSGAKNSAVDGAKNHLFREVKNAVKEWFQSKIQEILGVPKAIIDKLIKGGFTLEKIVKETWAAVVPQLPFIIGEIVLTKVVAKLIPGAGWVMAVIDALKTAIGALSEILKAIGAVITWLKAVRSGGAGILFAKALAAGVVALLELAYEFLLSGIGKYVGKVGRRLKNVAKNLGKGKKDKPGGDKDAGADGSDPRNNNKGGDKKDQERDPDKPGTTAKPAGTTPGTPRPGLKPDSKADPAKPATPATDKSAPGKQPPPSQGKDKKTDPTKPKSRDSDPSPATSRHNDGGSRPDRTSTSKPDGASTKDQDGADSSRPHGSRDRTRDQDRDADDGRNRGDGSDGTDRRDKTGSPGNNRNDRRDADDKARPDKDDESKQEKKDKRKEKENSEESKAARLRKIIARIRPKLSKVVRRGVPRPAMRALLAGMKRWHRLTALFVEKGSERSVKAVLNPSGNALENIEEGEELARKNESELLAALENQGDKLLDDSRLPALAQELSEKQAQYQERRKEAKKENRNPSEETRQAREAAVEMYAIREGLRPAGSGFLPAHERIVMAHDDDWDVQVSEQQGAFRGADNPRRGQSSAGLIKVLSGFGQGGHYLTPPGGNPGGSVVDKLELVQEQLEHYLRANKLGGPDHRQEARRRIKAAYFALLTGSVPDDPFFRDNIKAAETVGAAARLMGTVEGARYPAAAMTNVIAWQLADFPGATWEDVAARTNTMSPPKAVRASAYLVDPTGIERDKTNSKKGGLTVEGQEDKAAVTAMRANARLLLTRAFASNMSGVLYLSEEELVKKFPVWAKHNAARFLSPGGIWVP